MRLGNLNTPTSPQDGTGVLPLPHPNPSDHREHGRVRVCVRACVGGGAHPDTPPPSLSLPPSSLPAGAVPEEGRGGRPGSGYRARGAAPGHIRGVGAVRHCSARRTVRGAPPPAMHGRRPPRSAALLLLLLLLTAAAAAQDRDLREYHPPPPPQAPPAPPRRDSELRDPCGAVGVRGGGLEGGKVGWRWKLCVWGGDSVAWRGWGGKCEGEREMGGAVWGMWGK